MSAPRSNRPWLAAALTLALLVSGATIAAAQDDSGWPRQFESPSGIFVMYQPQPEQLEGDTLFARAAFSLQKGRDQAPAFGVLWFTARIEVDRDSSTVTERRLDVTRVRLPGITPEEADRYENLVEAQAAGWGISGSLEALRSGLAAAAEERASVDGIDNTPPRILFHGHRAILVVYDGAPQLESIEGTDLERVVNTPFAVVYDPPGRAYYLNGANLWYRAEDPLGPWTPVEDPPEAVRDAVPPDTSRTDQVAGPPPDVLTATVPTELIATDGMPRYAPLVGDELLYLTNTESDVILDVDTQLLYVLLSGRWYRSKTLDGPWTYVRGDGLPESFGRIPPDSPKGNVLAGVAGTDQADDALADAEIPQTSAIRRDDRSFRATYDGEPQFEPIEGTDLEYAVNTDAEVIEDDGRYYACDQGVWYVADDPEGPWIVSDVRPVGVEEIPPSCPIYDVRYVYIYDATPEVVYVGYTPGYLGCYPYYGTVVYGTGFRYRAWRGRHHYHPWRLTWGIDARYNPWLSRWHFGMSYGSGFFHVGFRWRLGPKNNTYRPLWFGPGGYRRPLVAADMALLRSRPSTRARTRVSDGLPANVYSRSSNVARVDRTRVRSVAPRIVRPPRMRNDVFAGQDGQVYRRDTKGNWRVRTGNKWKPTSLPLPEPANQPGVISGTGYGTQTPRPQAKPPKPVPPATVPPDRPAPTQEPPRARPPEPPAVQPDRPAPTQEPPRALPPPPSERPSRREEHPQPSVKPGDLEREFRARERTDQEKSNESDKDRRKEQREEAQRQREEKKEERKQEQEQKREERQKERDDQQRQKSDDQQRLKDRLMGRGR